MLVAPGCRGVRRGGAAVAFLAVGVLEAVDLGGFARADVLGAAVADVFLAGVLVAGVLVAAVLVAAAFFAGVLVAGVLVAGAFFAGVLVAEVLVGGAFLAGDLVAAVSFTGVFFDAAVVVELVFFDAAMCAPSGQCERRTLPESHQDRPQGQAATVTVITGSEVAPSVMRWVRNDVANVSPAIRSRWA
jgi:hypothetical protein